MSGNGGGAFLGPPNVFCWLLPCTEMHPTIQNLKSSFQDTVSPAVLIRIVCALRSFLLHWTSVLVTWSSNQITEVTNIVNPPPLLGCFHMQWDSSSFLCSWIISHFWFCQNRRHYHCHWVGIAAAKIIQCLVFIFALYTNCLKKVTLVFRLLGPIKWTFCGRGFCSLFWQWPTKCLETISAVLCGPFMVPLQLQLPQIVYKWCRPQPDRWRTNHP